MTTPWSCSSPTTAPAPRAARTARSTTRGSRTSTRRGPEELAERIDELGGPSAHNNYPWGWTMAGNTPFKRWKREVHEGGVADPCIVSWPARFAETGAIRPQFVHAVDILPTVLELAGIEPPATIGHVPQSRLDGISFAPILGPGGASAPRPHGGPSTSRCSGAGPSTTRGGRR